MDRALSMYHDMRAAAPGFGHGPDSPHLHRRHASSCRGGRLGECPQHLEGHGSRWVPSIRCDTHSNFGHLYIGLSIRLA